ncbi:hypothetical protein [Dokdonella soli]|uniref:hypothetical protein n=1 Tax=Dokdonella soli TaxID=529810 RepID=UPI0031D60CC9
MLTQSELAKHIFPAVHFEQVGPPQSISVSPPFLTPSKHVGAAQVPAVQTWLWQSLPTLQPLPMAHAAQVGPPQSTSVSFPFFTPSEQLAGWQVPALQTRFWQSLPLAQIFPSAHGLQ